MNNRKKVKIFYSLNIQISIKKKLEEDAEMFKKNIATINASIKEIKRREEMYMENMAATAAGTVGERDSGNRSAFLNMLYLKNS